MQTTAKVLPLSAALEVLAPKEWQALVEFEAQRATGERAGRWSAEDFRRDQELRDDLDLAARTGIVEHKASGRIVDVTGIRFGGEERISVDVGFIAYSRIEMLNGWDELLNADLDAEGKPVALGVGSEPATWLNRKRAFGAVQVHFSEASIEAGSPKPSPPNVSRNAPSAKSNATDQERALLVEDPFDFDAIAATLRSNETQKKRILAALRYLCSADEPVVRPGMARQDLKNWIGVEIGKVSPRNREGKLDSRTLADFCNKYGW